jgi:hypothetical protein
MSSERAAAAAGASRARLSVDSFKRHVQPELRLVRFGRLRLVPVRELETFLERHAARTLAGDEWPT